MLPQSGHNTGCCSPLRKPSLSSSQLACCNRHLILARWPQAALHDVTLSTRREGRAMCKFMRRAREATADGYRNTARHPDSLASCHDCLQGYLAVNIFTSPVAVHRASGVGRTDAAPCQKKGAMTKCTPGNDRRRVQFSVRLPDERGIPKEMAVAGGNTTNTRLRPA